ncbi:lytic murein transglycosylase [Nocardioides bruguierae]|uniref:Lytic murein transglycosylase n=1 Tax=Nocardioides bruguierae TaxID=2945102 RepID=A0A9X2D6F5_9ACTN|nr:lytic murein transglycosylase [Nocardioides bruguierae]MCM0620058.1 lytic murein transglycosylase [Nocardioides bruguierae]
MLAGLGWLYHDEPVVDLTPAETYVPAPVERTTGARSSLDPAWVRRTAERTGIPAPAVRAYATAQTSGVAGCDLGWTTLAGIGWVESQHGTLYGRTLRADGTSSSPILGPALDGREGFAAIRATPAGTAWHGDSTWEHAVGPMQFLPSTWAGVAVDGDRDGSRDPFDLDDAAAGAARYLCADGDLDSSQAWTAAVLRYNRSEAYARDVAAAALEYADEAAG